jgi:hypothetical protein
MLSVRIRTETAEAFSHSPYRKVTMQWFTTDSGTSTHIDLQLSLDGVNFFDVVQGVGPSGVITSDGQIAVAARARLQNLTPGGPNPTITAIIGVEPTVTGLSITQS